MLGLLTALQKWSGQSSSFLTPHFALSVFVIMGFVVLTTYVTRFQVAENQAAGELLGALIAAFTVVIAYWFSRRGGKDE